MPTQRIKDGGVYLGKYSHGRPVFLRGQQGQVGQASQEDLVLLLNRQDPAGQWDQDDLAAHSHPWVLLVLEPRPDRWVQANLGGLNRQGIL